MNLREKIRRYFETEMNIIRAIAMSMIFFHPVKYLMVVYLLWLLLSIGMTFLRRNKKLYDPKREQIITIEKSWILFVEGHFPQIGISGNQIGQISDIYFRPFLKSLPSKKYGGIRK